MNFPHWSWKAVVGSAVIVLAILIAYSNAMLGQFLYDDRDSIVTNESIRSIWPLANSLRGPTETPTAGRPIVNLSFALNFAVGRLDVFGYHLINVALHCANATLLFALLLRTLTSAPWGHRWRASAPLVSFVVTSLWALHPLQTESVTYVTQRTELLMAFFLLTTLWASRRAWDATTPRTNYAWQTVSVASCALGMASKEVMVVAPVIVLLYDVAVLDKPLKMIAHQRRLMYLGMMATWGILAWLLASSPRGRSVGIGLGFTPWDYLTTQAWAITNYLRLTLWPIGLCGDYGVSSITDPTQWLPGFILMALLVGMTVLTWFRYRVLSFLGIWFFLILAPTSSFVPIVTEPIAERRMYLPLAAVILLVVLGLIECIRIGVGNASAQNGKMASSWVVVLSLFAVAIASVLGFVTNRRNEVYRSEVAFWSDVTLKCPHNTRGLLTLGMVHMKSNQFELAKEVIERAIRLEPTNAQAHCNLGKCFAEQGNFAEASVHFDRAIAANPKLAEAFHNRAILRLAQLRTNEAISDFETAIRISPTYSPSYLGLGNYYASTGQLELAAENYQHAIQWDSQSSVALLNLGVIFAQKGEYKLAIDSFRKALAIDPRKADAYKNLGLCYAAIGQIEQAIAVYMQCVSYHPNDAHAWMELGKLYIQGGNPNDARRCLERALQIQPDSEQAKQLLNQIGPM